MRARRLLTALSVLGFALYPLSLALATNVGVLPLPAGDVWRAALAAVGLATALLTLMFVVTRGRQASAQWLGYAALIFVSYGWLLANGWLFSSNDPEAWTTALTHTIVSLAVATALVLPWSARPRDPVPLGILAVAMLSVNLLTAAWALPARGERWRETLTALVTAPSRQASSASAVAPAPVPAPSRDIYYIVVDAFGRPDVLRQYYGLELAPFLEHLRQRGFYIPDQARSNYAQTYLSIGATLNFDYIDRVAQAVGHDSSDRRPLGQAIADNALMEAARQAGYRIAVVTSDYEATRSFARAEQCDCEQFGLSGLEEATIAATPLAALPLNRWTTDAHRRKVLASFAALERPLETAGHTLTFAHIVSPHPPFVFYADGRPRTPPRTLFGFGDGDHFRGGPAEYADGYRQQAEYIAARLTQLVDTLLARPGPNPAIVIHGDHGPGSMLRWEDPNNTNMDERFGILAAYYFPGDSGTAAPLYSTMTPVNGARALASRYFNVRLPFLPDRSQFSTWRHPYDLRPVPAE